MDKTQAMEFLSSLMKEVNTQNNRFTASPFYFQVQSREWQVCPEEDDDAVEFYLWDCEPIETKDLEEMSDEEKIDNFGSLDMDIIIEDMSDPFYQKIVWAGKGIFLTEKAANEHILLNNYHYHNPRTYVKHFWRNYEMEQLFEAISVISACEDCFE